MHMDFRDILEVSIGFTVALILAVFVFNIWGVEYACRADKAEIERLKAELIVTDDNEKFSLDDAVEEIAPPETRLVEVCVNRLLHYRTSLGSISPRWNPSGTLIKCDFGALNISSIAEPDLKK